MKSTRLNFPVISKIKLNSFTLYSKNPSISIDKTKNVLCLAGANGIGKSTFLNIMNFALTGSIPDTSKFQSIEEYKGSSKDYFSGRISESDREKSSITIEMRIADRYYKISRGFFSNGELCTSSKGWTHKCALS